MNPEQLKYAPTHEWARLEETGGQQIATVGVSAFALEALTDLVFLELPKVGSTVAAGQSMGEIESVKAVSDLFSPVSGEVIEIHQGLADRLETLSNDPYGDGWMVKIRVTDKAGQDKLLDHAAYQRQCQEESH